LLQFCAWCYLKTLITILKAFFHFCFALVIKFLAVFNDYISFITGYFENKCLRSSFWLNHI
jgi:hypothetical protein